LNLEADIDDTSSFNSVKCKLLLDRTVKKKQANAWLTQLLGLVTEVALMANVCAKRTVIVK